MRNRDRYYLWDKAADAVRPVGDVLEWSAGFEDVNNRRVAMDEISTPSGEVVIYSSFLGIDHRFLGDGPPLLFETMATVDGDWCDLQYRFSASKDALNLHRALAAHVRAGNHPDTFGQEKE